MTKQSLLKGTIILTIGALITRILGFANGIVMANVLGPEGVGLIMMAMPVTGLLITLTTLGLPVAISKLVAEAEVKNDPQRVKKILIVSLTTTSVIGILLMGGALIGAKVLASIFLTDQRAYYSLLAVIPIIPIIAVSSVIKGYFRGKQNMTPIALSQVIEQFSRIGFIFLFVQWLLPYGLEFAAAGAVLSGIIGEAFSLLYLMSAFKWFKRRRFSFRQPFSKVDKGKRVFFDLMHTGLPTTGNGLIHSLIGVIQPILITQSLAIAGVGTALATQQFGIVMGFVIPLLMLPGFVTNSLSIPLIPAISEAKEQNATGLIHKRTQQSIRIALIVGVPSSLVLWLFADQLTTVIYNSPEAAILLKMMAPFHLLQYFRIPLQAVITGLGKANLVMVNDLIANAAKLAFIFLLASRPDFGIYGVCLGISASVILGTLLHFATISKLVGFRFVPGDFIKVGLSGAIMGFVGHGTFDYLSTVTTNQILLLCASVFVTMLTYLLLLLFLGVIKLRLKR
ncbi:stage V sporulation protein B [Halobacillus sp. Marseille-Q1614]|uniref:stage V sporulation protein B n=1 Tax=Halobacillus sp. Marseille-Q1614 TaxID=2709134 RepID=UPI00156FA582|nr:stage V sporulation protein B [Halobacillus sp. Marseille-Q1614]